MPVCTQYFALLVFDNSFNLSRGFILINLGLLFHKYVPWIKRKPSNTVLLVYLSVYMQFCIASLWLFISSFTRLYIYKSWIVVAMKCFINMYHESNSGFYNICQSTRCFALFIFNFLFHRSQGRRGVLCIQLQDVDIQVFESKCRD